jgi:hypothetical protein
MVVRNIIDGNKVKQGRETHGYTLGLLSDIYISPIKYNLSA